MPKPKNADYDTLRDSSFDNEFFFKDTQTVIREVEHIYLGNQIQYTHDYAKLIHFFYTASENSEIVVHLYNYGGACTTGAAIINAIRNSRARVIMNVLAPCYSMGAILAIAGDALVMNENTYLMFHNYSSVEIGKGKELEDSMNNSKKWLHKFNENVCMPFLDKAEIDALKNDNDVYVHWDDVKPGSKCSVEDRIKRHFNIKARKPKVSKK